MANKGFRIDPRKESDRTASSIDGERLLGTASDPLLGVAKNAKAVFATDRYQEKSTTDARVAVVPSITLQLLQQFADLEDFRALLAEYLRESTREIHDVWFKVEVRERHADQRLRYLSASPLGLDLGKGIKKIDKRPQHFRLPALQVALYSTQPFLPVTEPHRPGDVTGYDANKVTETSLVEWFGPDVGILVFDRMNDGIGPEDLFGDRTITGRDVANGFEDLAAFDRNRDRVIDRKDPIFHKLRVWRDANSNGRCDDGELQTLEELGVVEILLPYVQTDDASSRQKCVFKTTRAQEIEGQITEARVRVVQQVPGLVLAERPLVDLELAFQQVDDAMDRIRSALGKAEQ